MWNKQAISSDMIVAFLKDANVTGASIDVANRKAILHLDEGEPDVSIDLTSILALYVEKVAGKDLSDNNYTDADKARLHAIQDQVQVDWEETDTGDVRFILNKPNVYLPSNSLRDVLNALSDDGNGNLLYRNVPADSVQPDWLETNNSHKTYIKNKPTLHEHANKTVIDAIGDNGNGLITYYGVVVSGVQPDWNETNSNHATYIKNKPTLYDPANKDVLDNLGYNSNGLLTYQGTVVDTQSQSDWNENDSTKPWFIRNKPDVYLPTHQVRDTLNKFSTVNTTNGDRVFWDGNKIAYSDELITEAEVGKYGIITTVVITNI